MMKLKNKKTISISLLFLLLPSFIAFYCLQKENNKPFFNDKQNKIWAHRGLSVDSPENSIESINTAFKSGFPGVEIDIWFDSGLNRFIISHDFPYIMQNSTLLNLQTVLDSINTQDFKFWMDLKNLNSSNVDSVLSRLTSINNKYKIKDKVFIESHNAKELSSLADAGFFTSLFLKPIINIPFLYKLKNNFINLYHICIYNFNAISLPANAYTEFNKSLYKNNNVHLWLFTGNIEDLDVWTKMPEVKIILFDGNL